MNEQIEYQVLVEVKRRLEDQYKSHTFRVLRSDDKTRMSVIVERPVFGDSYDDDKLTRSVKTLVTRTCNKRFGFKPNFTVTIRK